MGGFGSGKGFRLQAAKIRKRLYVTEVLSLNYKSIDMQNINLSIPAERLHDENVPLHFKMKRHIMPGGGVWHSFLCQCGSAVRTLYLHKGRFACRRCHGLAYSSENKGKADRPIEQKWKHLHKLGCDDNCAKRPKWMKGHVFEKICDKIEWYDRMAYARFFGC